MKLPSVQQLAEHLCQPPLLLSLLGLILLFVPLASFASAPEAPMGQAEPRAKPGEILVKFEADVSSLAIETTHQTLGTSVIEVIPQLNVYRLRIPQETTIAEMIELYERTPGVAYAEPNYYVYALETHPDDGRYPDQWALDAIEAPAAWDITTGTNDIVVAIIDTGIDYTHLDLAGGRYIVEDSYDFVNDDDDPMDDEGHGTHVTGIATADTNNGQGIAGLVWNSRFMGVKVLDAEGVGTVSDVADGIIYAATRGAHVANLSLGSPFDSHTLRDAMERAYTEGRDGKGMVMACAVGNSYGPDFSYPAAYSQCLGVAATDRNDERAAFSSYARDVVDVAAPGVDILSTAGGGYESWSGTSMATPHVTGLAGLILAQDPELPVDQVFAAIRDSADDVNAETDEGRDDYLGTGRINAYRALTALVRIEPPDTMADPGSSFTVTVDIEDITDLGSFRFEVTYDPSVVTVEGEGVDLGGFLGSTGRDVSEIGPDIDNEAGVTSYEAHSSGAGPGANGTGVLATITFNAVGLGSSALHLENVRVTRTSGSVIPVVVQDGSVTVADAFVTIEPPETTVRVGSSFVVTASIRDVIDLGSFQFDLTYVSSTLTVTHAVRGPFLESTGRTVISEGLTIDNAAGRLTFGCSSEGGEPGPDGTGALATITFNAAGLGSSPLHFESVQATDTADVAIAVGAQDGNVTVTTGCREDVNGDGAINIVDIQLVAARWNTAEGDPDYDPVYDINDDGRIDIVDIQRVAAKWNTTC